MEKTTANITDSIFMTIGDKPITQSDLVDEIKIILILNNQSYSDEKREVLHELAIKSTIKRNIKLIVLFNSLVVTSKSDFFLVLGGGIGGPIR